MSRRFSLLGCLVTSTLVAVGVAAGPARAASPFDGTDYVALGDSYSSGVGAPGQTGSCQRSPNGFPSQWADRNDPGTFTNLSCGGAVTSDVRLKQVPQMSASADLITITIGGNDAGFAPVVLSCKVSSDATCARIVATARDMIRNVLPAKLDATYAAIKAKAPGARVVVLGYPLLFDTASANCGVGAMSLGNRRTLNAGAQELNSVIQSRVRAAGFTFTDVRDNFAGHGVCAATPYINGLTIAPPQNSYHPNQRGYTNGYLPALTSALN